MTVPAFKNFSEVLEHWAAHEPEKTYLVDLSNGKRYSYGAFNTLVNRATRFLQKAGARPGSIVSLRIRNSADFLMLYFACARGGFIVNPFPVSASDEELAKNLTFIKPKLVILEKKASTLPRSLKTVVIGRKGRSAFENFLKKYPSTPFKNKPDSRKIAALYLSSGTTGNPKGMLLSHANVIARADTIGRGFGHTHDTVHFGFLPMAHTSITEYSILPVTYLGGTMVIAENFISIRKNFWKILKKYRVRYVQAVPTILFSILNTDYPRYSTKGLLLPYVGCGSAPLPLSTQAKFKKKFGIPVANLYGCSETSEVLFDDPTKKGWRAGSIGSPLDPRTCKLLDDNGTEVPRGAVGEIAFKSPTVCVGYYKNPRLFKRSKWRGFFLTGDLAYKNREGRYFYVDRKKDLIIKGGLNIFPGEIDEVLFKHPAVLEASTIGVPDTYLGEEIVSFVVLKKAATEAELIAHCAKFLQYVKCPARIIFVKSIPKTASGKLLRKNLRALYHEKYRK